MTSKPLIPPVRQVRLEDLTPYAQNSRTHSDAQIANLVRSIQRFGWTNPVLINGKGGIIAGHGRVLAAKEIGMLAVPCIRLDHLSEAEERALIIADNALAEQAGWDEAMLRAELEALAELDFDLSLTGVEEREIKRMLASIGGATDPDEAPELAPAVSIPGDIWIMGDHRIICGSSTDAQTVEALLDGARPHLMVTDPPYGVEYDAAKARPTSKESARGKVLNDDRADWREAWALFPGDVMYVWHAMLHSGEVIDSIESCQFVIRAEIIWAKSQLVMSRGHYHPKHESCWYAVRDGAKSHWAGDRKQTTVWEIDKPMKSETGHSTQKPIECMRRPIENNSRPGDMIYEPFSGSGTTIIAGEMTARRVFAVELNPQYVDVAVRRWEQFTEGRAILKSSGQSFAEVAALRVPQPEAA